MRTLIVEDNATSRELLVRLLRPFGPCQSRSDGPAALELLKESLVGGESFDLICLDVMMPQMDGHEVLAAFRDLEEEHKVASSDRCKVLMITAVDSPSCIERARENVIDGYMVKPIRRVSLYDELQRLGLVREYTLA